MAHYLRQFFRHSHLPLKLQATAVSFEDLAQELDDTLPENPEKTTAIRRLLEAKDCAIRALLFEQEDKPTPAAPAP